MPSSFRMDQDHQDAVKLNDPAVFGSSDLSVGREGPQAAADSAGELPCTLEGVSTCVCVRVCEYVCVGCVYCACAHAPHMHVAACSHLLVQTHMHNCMLCANIEAMAHRVPRTMFQKAPAHYL